MLFKWIHKCLIRVSIILVTILAFSFQKSFASSEDSLAIKNHIVRVNVLYNEKRQYDSIFYYLSEVEVLSMKIKDYDNYIFSLLARSTVSDAIGDFESVAYYTKKSYKEGMIYLPPNHNYMRSIHNNLGVYFSDIGDNYRAISHMKKARKILESQPQNKNTYANYIRSSQNLGSFIAELGDVPKGISYLEKALQMSLDSLSTNPLLTSYVSESYYDLAYWLYFQKDYKRSINLHKQNLLFIKKNDPTDLSRLIKIHIHLADVYRTIDLPSKGLESLNMASQIQLEYKRKHNQGIREMNFYNIRAKCYSVTGEFQKAYKDIELALDLARDKFSSEKKSILVGNLLITHGDVFLGEKKYDLALKKYKNALQEFSTSSIGNDNYSIPDSKDFLSIDNGVLEILVKKNKVFLQLFKLNREQKYLDAAYQNSHLLSQLADRYRQQLQTQGSQLFISTELKPAYEQAIEIALELYQLTKEETYLEEAFKISEKSKAALLSNALTSTNAKYTGGVPDSVLSQERELLANISFYKKQVFEEKNKVAGFNEARINQWERKIFELEREKDEFDDKLEKTYPLYFQYKNQTEEISLTEIQQSLGSNTQLIEYFTGDSVLYVFTITKTGLNYKAIEKSTSLYERILTFSEQLADVDKQAQGVDDFKEEAHSLFKVLLGEGREKDKKYIIIPDGILGRLPFELLLIEASDKKNFTRLPYVFTKHEIQYGYSALLLFKDPLKRSYNQAERIWAGFAPSFDAEKRLLYNQDEVEEIHTKMKGSSYVMQSADLKTFLAQAANYRILHLATHGYADVENPQFSKLEFTYQDSLNDGILYAHELANQKLNAELVVLSACETGHGNIAKGEGIMSLAWSFRYAGVPSIVMSLWKAESNVSKRLMSHFYAHLNEGESKAKALQLAKLDYLANPIPGKEHPRNWANFVMIGDDAPVSQDFNWWWAMGIFAILIAMILIGSRSKNKSIATS